MADAALKPLAVAMSGARAAAMGAWTLGAMQTYLLHLRTKPEPERHALRQAWIKVWARGLSRVFGVQQRLTSTPTPASRPRLVVANHRSPIDIILMLEHFGGCVLSHDGVADWPILGPAAREGGTIFVDREDQHSGAKAIRAIRRRLKDGHTVIVFPEGTTFQGDEVRPFLGGAFTAVRGLDAEIVPVGIAYDPGVEFFQETFMEHVTRVAQRRRTRVAISVGEAFAPQRDREAMATSLHGSVQALVQDARAALGR